MNFDFVIPVMWSPWTDNDVIYFGSLAQELKQRGYSVAFVTERRAASSKLDGYRCPCFTLPDMLKDVNRKESFSYTEETKRIEQIYSISSTNFCLAEKEYRFGVTGQDRLAKYMVDCFLAIENFMEKNSVKVLVQIQGGEIFRRTLYHVGRLRNTLNIWIDSCPLQGHVIFFSDELDKRNGLELKEYNLLTTTEREEAERFIVSFRNKKQMYLQAGYYFSARIENPLQVPFKFLNHLYHDFILDDVEDPRPHWRMDLKYVQRKLKKTYSDLFFEKPRKGENYIFSPLQLPLESELTVRAPQLFNQDYIAELMARSLPFGYKLYVKEHPNNVGELPFPTVRRISKIENVRWLHPKTHSHTLIENSSAVTVISSTAGFESIMYQKPVVVLGKPFYRGLGLTIDVDNLFNLPDAIREAILMKQIEHDKVVSFVSALLKHSYKGLLWDTSEENITAVADSILSYWKKAA